MSKKEAAESLETLRTILPKGARILAVLRGRTSSGTSYVDFYTYYTFAARSDAAVCKSWLSYHIAKALGLRFDKKRECVRLPFMNMDQAFEVTYRLGQRLHGEGYAFKSEWL